MFVDPDNCPEPDGYRHGSAKAGKSTTLDELRALTRPGRGVVVYCHHTRRKGRHHGEIEHWAGRLRKAGYQTVDALRARPFSPRVCSLLDAPADVRHRAEQIAVDWQGWITWQPDRAMVGGAPQDAEMAQEYPAPILAGHSAGRSAAPPEPAMPVPSPPRKSSRAGRGSTTQVGYVNRNQQEVIRPTDIPGTDHGQYVYVLRCRVCKHEYGANGSDIWLRRCPAHDRGAPGLAI